tara:strand:+ start:84 stop:476 length:393 start_codon:yes stop_codon:yes gene_type:complete
MALSNFLTPELTITDSKLCLIRVNREAIGFVNSEQEAILAIDSIGNYEQKRLERVSRDCIYRHDSRKGRSITLSSQRCGYLYNSSLIPIQVIDYITVNRYSLIKNRLEYMVKDDVLEDEGEDEPLLTSSI